MTKNTPEFELIAVATAEELKSVALLPPLFEAGLQTLHLRCQIWDTARFSGLLKEIPASYHSRIIVHNHYELAREYQLKGIHFTEKSKQSIPSIDFAKEYPGLQLSASFHSLAELKENTFAFEYVFLSPIFNSISKSGYCSAFQPWELVTFLQEYHKIKATKVIALGGIQSSNILDIHKIGFDGAALYGTLWESPDPAASLKEIEEMIANA
jgi:thiamine-phosphate pyrophosphorylase